MMQLVDFAENSQSVVSDVKKYSNFFKKEKRVLFLKGKGTRPIQ